MATLQELQNAGLPAVSTDGGVNASFSRPLTKPENLLFWSMVDVPRYKKEKAKDDVAEVSSSILESIEDWNDYYATELANGAITGMSNVPDIKLMIGKINPILNDLAKLVISLRGNAEL